MPDPVELPRVVQPVIDAAGKNVVLDLRGIRLKTDHTPEGRVGSFNISSEKILAYARKPETKALGIGPIIEACREKELLDMVLGKFPPQKTGYVVELNNSHLEEVFRSEKPSRHHDISAEQNALTFRHEEQMRLPDGTKVMEYQLHITEDFEPRLNAVVAGLVTLRRSGGSDNFQMLVPQFDGKNRYPNAVSVNLRKDQVLAICDNLSTFQVGGNPWLDINDLRRGLGI